MGKEVRIKLYGESSLVDTLENATFVVNFLPLIIDRKSGEEKVVVNIASGDWQDNTFIADNKRLFTFDDNGKFPSSVKKSYNSEDSTIDINFFLPQIEKESFERLISDELVEKYHIEMHEGLFERVDFLSFASILSSPSSKRRTLYIHFFVQPRYSENTVELIQYRLKCLTEFDRAVSLSVSSLVHNSPISPNDIKPSNTLSYFAKHYQTISHENRIKLNRFDIFPFEKSPALFVEVRFNYEKKMKTQERARVFYEKTGSLIHLLKDYRPVLIREGKEIEDFNEIKTLSKESTLSNSQKTKLECSVENYKLAIGFGDSSLGITSILPLLFKFFNDNKEVSIFINKGYITSKTSLMEIDGLKHSAFVILDDFIKICSKKSIKIKRGLYCPSYVFLPQEANVEYDTSIEPVKRKGKGKYISLKRIVV